MQIATPKGYSLSPDIHRLVNNHDLVHFTHKPEDALDGAHVIITDTWVSMGMESEKAKRLHDFAGYRVLFSFETESDPFFLTSNNLSNS